ncbi:toxin-antitoxin system HicB family antitoxin [Chryseobacterium suipulveris]|uniref:Toxin-antitoxin system HicB family antitoxin n=1 Tax=Chryseobacterium suipulveris TaxID=2929800 RepID=A0ABY4BP50_9FLAO|nr:toxin-antitoxin system HicB family antitoxin [Chryseobacterium suipulveris]UOE40968.1 toxin-antitoxin system HicB family antitoxin [Chryseobacterium suipulveris]
MIKEKKLTSIRIDKNLYLRLQMAAKRENRSLNNFIETALYESVSYEPNEETIAAMEEVQEMIKNGTGKPIKNIREFLEMMRDEDGEEV